MCTLHDSNIQSVMFSERKKKTFTYIKTQPFDWFGYALTLRMDWIIFFLGFLSKKKEKCCTHLFHKIRNEMTGHFLYYICIFQHKKLLQKALKIFVVRILKYWAFLWCKSCIDYFIKSSFFLSHLLAALMSVKK